MEKRKEVIMPFGFKAGTCIKNKEKGITGSAADTYTYDNTYVPIGVAQKTLCQAAHERRHADALATARRELGPNASQAQVAERLRVQLNQIYDQLRVKEQRKVS